MTVRPRLRPPPLTPEEEPARLPDGTRRTPETSSASLTTSSPAALRIVLSCRTVAQRLRRSEGEHRWRTSLGAGGSRGGPTVGWKLFSESISFDRRLFEHDVRGSIAHARMLASVGLLTDEECRLIERGLSRNPRRDRVGGLPDRPRTRGHPHARRGRAHRPTGGRRPEAAHGRSRNDQVATDLKLWVRDALDKIDAPIG